MAGTGPVEDGRADELLHVLRPEEMERRRIQVHDQEVALDEDGGRRVLDNRAEPALALLQGQLEVPALGNVLDDAEDAVRRPVVGRGRMHGDDPAVPGAASIELDVVAALGGDEIPKLFV